MKNEGFSYLINEGLFDSKSEKNQLGDDNEDGEDVDLISDPHSSSGDVDEWLLNSIADVVRESKKIEEIKENDLVECLDTVAN